MSKWTEQPEAAWAAPDDLLLIVADPAGTPASKKIKKKNLLGPALIVFEFGDGLNESPLEADMTARIPYVPAGTIIRARIESDAAGDAVVNIRKSTSDPPSYSSIAASAKPTLSSDELADDATLTGWDTGLNAGDALLAVLESVSGLKQVTVVLEVLKS